MQENLWALWQALCALVELCSNLITLLLKKIKLQWVPLLPDPTLSRCKIGSFLVPWLLGSAHSSSTSRADDTLDCGFISPSAVSLLRGLQKLLSCPSCRWAEFKARILIKTHSCPISFSFLVCTASLHSHLAFLSKNILIHLLRLGTLSTSSWHRTGAWWHCTYKTHSYYTQMLPLNQSETTFITCFFFFFSWNKTSANLSSLPFWSRPCCKIPWYEK